MTRPSNIPPDSPHLRTWEKAILVLCIATILITIAWALPHALSCGTQ